MVDEKEHTSCITWGIFLKKYENANDWVKACIENGRRVAAVLRV